VELTDLVRALSRHSKSWPAPLVVLLLLVASDPVQAEEGGSGHYLPGSISSFVDGVSATEVFISRLNGVYYDGSFEANRPVPIAGQAALDVDVESEALGLTAFWRPSWGDLGEDWSFAMSATIPLLRVEVEADLAVPGVPGATQRRRDTETGLGDILLMPLMFNYHVNEDLNVNARLGIYAPTGDYEEGRLANLGKNYWTFEPMLGVLYFGQKTGREASFFLGADFNTENRDTQYQTGTQMHAEATLAQHLPLGKSLVGVGLTGYWYHQVEGDRGSGASFGSFKARANGIGPTLSLTHPIGTTRLLAELKWVHEFGVERRPEGDVVLLKVMLAF
jgi:hypothetical protein